MPFGPNIITRPKGSAVTNSKCVLNSNILSGSSFYLLFVHIAIQRHCDSDRDEVLTVRNICSQISAGVSFGYIEDPHLAISAVV